MNYKDEYLKRGAARLILCATLTVLMSAAVWAQSDPGGTRTTSNPSAAVVGAVLREIPFPSGESLVNGIAFQPGAAGSPAALWVTGFNTKKIYKLDFASGAVLSSFSPPTPASPSDLAWDGTNLYETDFGINKVTKLSPTGTSLASFNCPGTSGGCEGVAFDGTNLFIGNAFDSKIYKVNPAGTTLSSFNSPGGAGGADGLGYNAGPNALWILGYDNTLYQVNAATGAPIGSGIPLASGSYDGGEFDGNAFWVANNATGKLQAIDLGAPPPIQCNATLNKTSYVNGDVITAQSLIVTNGTGQTMNVEYKFWFDGPGLAPVSFWRGGADDTVSLPAGFNQNLGPMTLATVSASLPRGSYAFSCRLLDPVTGALKVEDINPFTVN